MDVYISNTSHPLHMFEYTQENNMKGITLKLPPSGWLAHTWQHLSLPIDDDDYSFPMSTAWDRMDRLELYYAWPHWRQPRTDYVRVRNIFLRSRQPHARGHGPPCKEVGARTEAQARRQW